MITQAAIMAEARVAATAPRTAPPPASEINIHPIDVAAAATLVPADAAKGDTAAAAAASAEVTATPRIFRARR